jgi:hypothetical protein
VPYGLTASVRQFWCGTGASIWTRVLGLPRHGVPERMGEETVSLGMAVLAEVSYPRVRLFLAYRRF